MSSRLVDLYNAAGQSAWLDNLQRSYLTTRYLDDLVAQGVRGLTSNPTIFQKAIQDSSDYDDQFFSELRSGLSSSQAYWKLVMTDIIGASDVFMPMYEQSDGIDGYVSVEVDPRLARDTAGTIVAARELRLAINRPNVMIKIPGTIEGLPAITQMVSEGCPVNVTLIFSLERYAQVIEAFLCGLENRLANGLPLGNVHGVASFFISRVDSEIDSRLQKSSHLDAHTLLGTAAINQAKIAYELFTQLFSGARWERLQTHGAVLQRPLWASTSTKNPQYRDTMYIDELIGPHTVNTIPEPTMHAFINHGLIGVTIDKDLEKAKNQWGQLLDCGIDVVEVAQQLEHEGLASFVKSFDDLMESLRLKALEAQ
jgi:transaldolase